MRSLEPSDNVETGLPAAIPDDESGLTSTTDCVPTLGQPSTQAAAKKRRRPEPELGEKVGPYTLVSELGRGGMGVVFEAAHPRLTRSVALKLLPPEFADDADAVKRFLLEGRTASRIDDNNVVRVLDIGEADGLHYMAMELVKGGNAKEFLEARGAMNWPEATRVIAAACQGLIAVHRAGLVHRDIKPANIMRADDGRVKLADFGLAKSSERSHTSITAAGTVVGTPHYMSPEQCQAERLDARSDIYSLGATYFALLAGRAPFAKAGTPLQVMFAHCNLPVPDPRELVDPLAAERAAAGLGGRIDGRAGRDRRHPRPRRRRRAQGDGQRPSRAIPKC